jgi:hypothetical protein
LLPADLDSWVATGRSQRRTASAAVTSSGTYQVRVPLPGDYIVIAVPPDIAPDVDPDFVRRFAPQGVRVTFAAGESKSQTLTIVRVK